MRSLFPHLDGVSAMVATTERNAMTRKFALNALTGALLLALAGCGYTPGQRAVSGGLLGAGGGAALGAVTGVGAGTGALVGGGAGALGGALTAR
jgi:osmotically inducible lipoprotein OsmB